MKHAVFFGSYEMTLDAKHRLSVPAAVRKSIVPDRDGESLFAIIGQNRKIWLYTEKAYEQGAERDLNMTPGPQDIEFDHVMYGMANKLDMDAQFRILIPEKLLKKTGTENAVTLVGSRDHLELWNQADWAAYENDIDARRAEITAAQRAERGAERDKLLAPRKGSGSNASKNSGTGHDRLVVVAENGCSAHRHLRLAPGIGANTGLLKDSQTPSSHDWSSRKRTFAWRRIKSNGRGNGVLNRHSRAADSLHNGSAPRPLFVLQVHGSLLQHEPQSASGIVSRDGAIPCSLPQDGGSPLQRRGQGCPAAWYRFSSSARTTQLAKRGYQTRLATLDRQGR